MILVEYTKKDTIITTFSSMNWKYEDINLK